MKPIPTLFILIILQAVVVSNVIAQQVPDMSYRPPNFQPAYPSNEGPRIAIDEAHYNFHTAEGRYKAFAELLRRDGYRVSRNRESLSADSLKDLDVLVIANPLHRSNNNNWTLPTPSAFSKEEIEALRTWVEEGGSLLLIADHMPFPGGAGELAKSFGFLFTNGYAQPGNGRSGSPDTFGPKSGLIESVITRGRGDDEQLTKVVTFTGSAFKIPKGATPVLVFGAKSISREPQRAARFNSTTRTVPIEGWCQGAVIKVGSGRLAVFGEAMTFTAQLAGPTRRKVGMNAPEAKQNYKLVLNVMHWLSALPGMEE